MHAPIREPARWTVVIPFFNEARFLPATLASLAAQRLPRFDLVLVDNGSTDAGADLARDWAARHPRIATRLLQECRPGQVHALETGLAAVETPFVAICDADTFYPPDYLLAADRRLSAAPAQVVGFIGHNVDGDPERPAARLRRFLYSHVVPRLLPRQAHGGGYAHLLRTEALVRAGGYSARLWPFVLKDHELVHRLTALGDIRYAPDLWVRPSARRADRRAVRWTLFERLLYHSTPPALKDWFFYRFLAPRLAARGQRDTILRVRPWGAGQAA